MYYFGVVHSLRVHNSFLNSLFSFMVRYRYWTLYGCADTIPRERSQRKSDIRTFSCAFWHLIKHSHSNSAGYCVLKLVACVKRYNQLLQPPLSSYTHNRRWHVLVDSDQTDPLHAINGANTIIQYEIYKIHPINGSRRSDFFHSMNHFHSIHFRVHTRFAVVVMEFRDGPVNATSSIVRQHWQPYIMFDNCCWSRYLCVCENATKVHYTRN